MLLTAKESLLLLVDVQEKLTPLVDEHERLVTNCAWLIKLAQRMQVPTLVSEQYPKGLGHTVAPLRELFTQEKAMEKVHFSCASDQYCMQQIEASSRNQIVVIGIEIHVCILQTAMELAQHKKQVFVVSDAVASRNPEDKQVALQRMSKAGIEIVTREMVLFEWLHKAGTDQFRAISKEFLQ